MSTTNTNFKSIANDDEYYRVTTRKGTYSFSPSEELGRGAFGFVVKGKRYVIAKDEDSGMTAETVAFKLIPPSPNADQQARTVREINVLKALSQNNPHSGVLQYVDHFKMTYPNSKTNQLEAHTT